MQPPAPDGPEGASPEARGAAGESPGGRGAGAGGAGESPGGRGAGTGGAGESPGGRGAGAGAAGESPGGRGAGAAAAFKAFEAAGWSARAGTYEALMARATAHAIEPLLDAAGVTAGMRVLEVASGLGDLAAAAAARGALVTGVDLAAEMVNAASARHPGLDFRHGDAEDLPFADASFDAVLGAFVVNHLPEPERGIAEMVRVCRGRVALAMWAEEIALFALPGRAADAAGLRNPAPPGPDAERFAQRGELLGLLAGLDDVTVDEIAFELTVPSLDALWHGILGGTVRTSARLAGSERARRELARLAEPLRGATGYALPTRVRIATGRRHET